MALTATHFFRLEFPEGVEEFRVWDGRVETRQLQHDSTDDCEWRWLQPEQIADHVNRNTVVARWLMRRLGWRQLLRACITEESIRYLDMLDVPVERRIA